MKQSVVELRGFGRCYKCGKKIDGLVVKDLHKDPLTNRIIVVTVHVECYVPRLSMPVVVSDGFSEELKAKLAKWNLQFVPPDIKILIKPSLSLQIQFTPKRSWMEIFKFFSPEELTKLSEVSKTFYLYSKVKEIWTSITNLQGSTSEEIIKAYIHSKFGKCIVCDITSDLTFCTVLRRPFCQNCLKQAYIFRGIHNKLTLRPVIDLIKEYNVTWDFFDNIRTCMDRQFQIRTYPLLVERALDSQEPLRKLKKSPRKKQKLKELKE